jgi:hypothetical protein
MPGFIFHYHKSCDMRTDDLKDFVSKIIKFLHEKHFHVKSEL